LVGSAMKPAYLLPGLLPLLVLTWLFLGVERIPDEHEDRYDLFLKQRPTLRLIFHNPVTCGVCDTKPYQRLTASEKTEFAIFCRYRFGLDGNNECYAIFSEQQRAADAARGIGASPELDPSRARSE